MIKYYENLKDDSKKERKYSNWVLNWLARFVEVRRGLNEQMHGGRRALGLFGETFSAGQNHSLRVLLL